jgi:hypothetical protein
MPADCFSSFGSSATIASVVSIRPATDAKAVIPGEEAFQPHARSRCPLLKTG